MLDNDYALLFLRGERPVMDRKYNIQKHPHVKLSADGKAAPYLHGGAPAARATISLRETPIKTEEAAPQSGAALFYTVLSSDELEAELDKEESQ